MALYLDISQWQSANKFDWNLLKKEVDGVTGATFSSDAVKENVKLGLEYYKSHK